MSDKTKINEVTLMENKIHHVKLGDLSYKKGPQSINHWHGILSGCEQGFDIVLNAPNLDIADVDFISTVIQDWKYYEEKALEYIRFKLATQPELFNLSKEDGENASKLKKLFDCPQFIFYEKQEWMIIFLENKLGVGDQYGVSVNFNGETLTNICDLSESEEIEEE